MFILLFFLGLIQGLVSLSPDSPCFKQLEYFEERELIPDAAEIALRCPKTKSYLECEIKYVQRPDNEYQEVDLEELYNVRSLANDLCDEDSKLHKDYVKNVDCFRSMVDKWSMCEDLGRDIYSEYRKFATALEDPDTAELDEDERNYINESVTHYQPHCMIQSYAIACLGIQVLETCGADAYDVFVEIGHKSKEFDLHCGRYESNILKNEFVHFLSVEKNHPNMDRISDLFQLVRSEEAVEE